MKKALLAIGLLLAALAAGGVLVLNSTLKSLGTTGVLGGDCSCGDAGPSWSPDGKLILYSHNDYKKDARLYTITPAGGRPRRLTEHGSDGGAVWSPDGSKIAFAHSETDRSLAFGNESRSHLEVMDAGEGHARRLAENSGTDLLAWSPDGRTVAYQGADDGLHSIDVNGGSKLTFELGGSEGAPGTVDGIGWSPGGRRLVYTSGGQIYFATADAGLRWKDFKSDGVESVAWSPDGSRLAFTTERGVYVMGVDGRRLKRLGGSPDSVPVWSRAGKRLAWIDGPAIVVADPEEGKKRSLVPRGAYPFGSLDWSPDGGSLVVSAEPAEGNYHEGETRLFIVPVAHPGRARQLT
jgi:Tol biopolymer transport system component